MENAELASRWRRMKRDVVENRFDPTLFQAAQKARPLVQVRRLDIKHVRVMFAAGRNRRQRDPAAGRQRRQQLAVQLPAPHPVLDNQLRIFKLRKEISRVDIAGKKRRADRNPGIFIDLPAPELTSVRPFFPDNLGGFDPIFVLDQDRQQKLRIPSILRQT